MACATRTSAAFGLCAALVFADPARAQTPESEAKLAALEGKKAFEQGDYATAIRKYEAAQQLKPAPLLLFNLAQSHRFAGHVELATRYFRGYLTTSPPPVQARAIEALIERLQAQRLLEVFNERMVLEKTRLALAEKQFALGLCSELPPEPPVTSRWWFWTIIGAAAVGTAVTVAVAAAHP